MSVQIIQNWKKDEIFLFFVVFRSVEKSRLHINAQQVLSTFLLSHLKTMTRLSVLQCTLYTHTYIYIWIYVYRLLIMFWWHYCPRMHCTAETDNGEKTQRGFDCRLHIWGREQRHFLFHQQKYKSTPATDFMANLTH